MCNVVVAKQQNKYSWVPCGKFKNIIQVVIKRTNQFSNNNIDFSLHICEHRNGESIGSSENSSQERCKSRRSWCSQQRYLCCRPDGWTGPNSTHFSSNYFDFNVRYLLISSFMEEFSNFMLRKLHLSLWAFYHPLPVILFLEFMHLGL